MKQSTITLRTDPEFKKECDLLFSKMGLTTVAAISVFLHQAVACQAFPFKPAVVDDPLAKAVSRMPEAGYRNKDGVYVLPSDWNNPEDDVYDNLV